MASCRWSQLSDLGSELERRCHVRLLACRFFLMRSGSISPAEYPARTYCNYQSGLYTNTQSQWLQPDCAILPVLGTESLVPLPSAAQAIPNLHNRKRHKSAQEEHPHGPVVSPQIVSCVSELLSNWVFSIIPRGPAFLAFYHGRLACDASSPYFDTSTPSKIGEAHRTHEVWHAVEQYRAVRHRAQTISAASSLLVR